MKKLMKKVVVLAMALLVLTPALAFSTPVLASDAGDAVGWGRDANNTLINSADIGNNIGLGSTDPRNIAASVINVILGFLGIIAVVIILLGGFKWMTGGGNEDKVGEAKKLITAGVIGLVIILASWGIATFVISNLLTATGVPTT